MKKIFSSIIGGLAGAVALNVIHQAFKAIERNGAGKGFGIDFDYSHLTVYTRQPYHFLIKPFSSGAGHYLLININTTSSF